MILRGLDENVKVEDEHERERRDREVLVLVEDTEMEKRVVEEAIVAGFGRGTRRFYGGGVME